VKLDLETLIIEYDSIGPTCVRLPEDRPGRSSLNPTIERVLLDSPEVLALCQDADEDEPAEELDFG
jgi:hypothetical protein